MKISKLFLIPITLMVFAVLLALYEFVIFPYQQTKIVTEHEVTVTWKECVNYGNFWLEGKYLIFTEDASGDVHVFENMDNRFVDKNTTSDIYASIEIGKTYSFTAIGERDYTNQSHPYQNIISVELLD